MASIIKRKQQVNELRRAHFPFGFEDNKAVVSQYKKQYTEQPVSLAQPNGDRNSHFTIGSDQPAMAKNTYQSEFKEKYPEHQFVKQASLRKSNDENNIVLGFGGGQSVTNYKDQFTQKQQERNKPVDQRIISVDLGDSLTDFTTTYHKAYDGSQGERPERVNNSLANTNLVLGYDQGHFVTSNAATHNAKPIQATSTKGRHYGTNISLGTDGGQFHSEAKQQFSHKDSTMQPVDKERVLDFRSAHFKFGFPEQIAQNLTETQAHYNEKPLTAIKIEGKKPVNVELRHDSNNYFQSSYGDHFTEKKAERAEPISKDSRNSNVIIGMGGETYNTEAKDQFSAKQAERIKGKGAEGSLVLGDGTRDFTTHYQQTHGNKFNELQLNRVSKQEIAKLRVQNYVNGFTNPDYRLHSHNYGSISGGQGGKLPREVIDKMRGTNIVNSDSNNFYGSTTHKASYGWKKNEDF